MANFERNLDGVLSRLSEGGTTITTPPSDSLDDFERLLEEFEMGSPDGVGTVTTYGDAPEGAGEGAALEFAPPEDELEQILRGFRRDGYGK